MTRKQPLRLAIAEQEADDETVVRAHLAQNEPLLAAAALLPSLDRAAEGGHGPSCLAAALVRGLLAPGTVRDGSAGGDRMSAAVHRLTTLAAEQDVQIARLQAMLEALL